DFEYPRSRFRTEMRRLCEVIEGRLAQSAFLGGADYSIADMAGFPVTRTLEMFFPGATGGAATTRWREAIAARPATARALAKGDELGALDGASMKAASRDELDR